MSNQPKQRREEDPRQQQFAGHLAQINDRDDDDEDWGDVKPKASTPASVAATTTAPPKPASTSDLDRELDEDEEDDLEEELAGGSEEDDEDEEEDEPVNQTREVQTARVQERVEAPAPTLDETTVFQQIDQMQSNLPALVTVLERKLEGINDQRKKLDEEEKGVKARINFVRVLSGQSPLPLDEDEDEDEQSAPRKRGGRRKAVAADGASTASAAPAPVAASGTAPAAGEERPRGRGGRGKRHQNDQTLKEAICKVLLTMTHPTSGKPYTGFVNDITTKVTLPVEKGGMGYKSTSAKPTNTVRIQMYRLEEEGKVISNDDNSYTLRKRVVREMTGGAEPQQQGE